LVVEDSEEDAELLIAVIRSGGYDPTYERVETAEAMSAALDRQSWDIAFSDYSMPHFNGVRALKLLREKGLDIPFIFISGTIGEDLAVEAMKHGANDYVMKGNLKRLLPSVDRELREAAIRRAAEKELREAQAHLLQSDKMASLGQLAAGVAHEINNPVSFVGSNLKTLEEYVGDLLQLVGSYESLLSAVEGGERNAIEGEKKRGRSLVKQIDVGFLMADLSRLVAQSLDGMERIRHIITDLKEFSHVDRGERRRFNLNEGIESTLNIVWNELKYKAEVIKDLGDIPEVLCYPQQLNQVFMNLLVNAAQAMNERGKIWIRSYASEDSVVVEIEDSGCGIPEESIKKIFDPFFTTKPVGKGTGLGLSVSYDIVQKHNGKMEVESTVGKGTKFRVLLPITTG
jgi:signal transduction histidine kinase